MKIRNQVNLFALSAGKGTAVIMGAAVPQKNGPADSAAFAVGDIEGVLLCLSTVAAALISQSGENGPLVADLIRQAVCDVCSRTAQPTDGTASEPAGPADSNKED